MGADCSEFASFNLSAQHGSAASTWRDYGRTFLQRRCRHLYLYANMLGDVARYLQPSTKLCRTNKQYPIEGVSRKLGHSHFPLQFHKVHNKTRRAPPAAAKGTETDQTHRACPKNKRSLFHSQKQHRMKNPFTASVPAAVPALLLHKCTNIGR